MKSFVLRWTVLFIAANVFGFVVHGLLLHENYAANAGLHRTEAAGAKKAVAHNVVSDMNTEGVLPNN